MKINLLLFFVLCTLSACTKYDEFPLRPVSFEIDGKTYYSAKDTQTLTGNVFGGAVQEPEKFMITESDNGLDLHYVRRTDFLNYDMGELGLELKGLDASFKTGVKFLFSEKDSLAAYPYVYLNPVKTSLASDNDLYSAVEGWIEFYEINHVDNYVSGTFEFKAALDDDEVCMHPDTIEVRAGTFRNIPFVISNQEQL